MSWLGWWGNHFDCYDDLLPQVNLKELNDGKGLLVVLDGLNEQSVGVTSLVWKSLWSSGDLGESAVGPVDEVDWVNQLLLDALSVGLGVVPVSLVDVSDVGQILDDSGTDF